MADKKEDKPKEEAPAEKQQKTLQPGQVKGPYQRNKLWYYETVELGESCGFGSSEEAETNIDAYRTWVKPRLAK